MQVNQAERHAIQCGAQFIEQMSCQPISVMVQMIKSVHFLNPIETDLLWNVGRYAPLWEPVMIEI